jgi:hypothetical protein
MLRRRIAFFVAAGTIVALFTAFASDALAQNSLGNWSANPYAPNSSSNPAN